MGQERWFSFVLVVLATWRLTRLLAFEDGPGDVIANLRQRLGDGFLGKLMDCFYCLSLWIAVPMSWLLINKWSEWPLFWLALSGAACLLERLGNRPVAPPHTSPEEE
jgi:hypothetical protein